MNTYRSRNCLFGVGNGEGLWRLVALDRFGKRVVVVDEQNVPASGVGLDDIEDGATLWFGR